MIQGQECRRKGRRRYRRRAIVLNVFNLETYQKLVERREVTSPIPCPDDCHGEFKRHSSFSRPWVDFDCLEHTVEIVRVLCSSCRGVWSLFPAFIWYRFRYSYRVVQAACWEALSGESPSQIVESFRARLSPIVEEHRKCRVPTAATIRSWLKWLAQPCLELYVRQTFSIIARRSVDIGRAALALPSIPPGLPPALKTRERAERVLRVCAALDSAMRERRNVFARSPYQLRDWAWSLFREHRQMLARPT